MPEEALKKEDAGEYAMQKDDGMRLIYGDEDEEE
jgi:hypothetical protein